MYARYLDHLSRSSLLHEAPALKAISTGGSPLDPDLKRRVEAVFGLELRQAYGLTEAGPTVTIPDSRLQASTALGRPGRTRRCASSMSQLARKAAPAQVRCGSAHPGS
jgi:long-chain acyl-CoA synthetase